MTVSSTTNKQSYNGNASQTAFAYTFKIFVEADVKVYVGTTLKTLSTHYTLSGVGDSSGGNVTFTAGNVPAVGTGNVTILRSLALTQGVDLINYGKFDAEVVEAQYDKLVMMVQQLQEQADRTIRFSTTVSDAGGVEITDTVAERQGKVLAYDSSGDLSVANELGEWKANWATATAYVARDLILDAATNNVYICLIAHTSGTLSSDVSASKWSLVVNSAAVAASAAAAAADLVLTNADVVSTNADVVLTHADVVLAEADKVQTGLDRVATGNDKTATNADVVSTNADVVSTNADVVLTHADVVLAEADKVQTGLDKVATNADVVLTHADVVLAEADKVQTGLDRVATNADVVLTNADVVSAEADKVQTGLDRVATAADVVLTAADVVSSGTNATNAANSAASAATALDNFDDRYLGAKSSAPSVDNDGAALIEGAMYFDSSSNGMKVYDGASWIAASSAGTASMLTYKYIATSGQTTFSGNDSNSVSLTYTVANIIVMLNGITLDAADFTATSGTSIVLATGATANAEIVDELVVVAFKSFTVADHYTQAQADALLAAKAPLASPNFTGGIDVTGTVTASTGLTVGSPTNPTSSLAIVKVADSSTAISAFEITNRANADFVFKVETDLVTGGSTIARPVAFMTSNTERMRIDASGIVTKPYQPAFHAHGGGTIDTTSNTGVIIVEFHTTLVNTGGHYSTTNDRFTAPVAGVYTFSVGWMSMSARANRFGFYRNGSLLGDTGFAVAETYQRTTYGVTATLSANDYVDFRTNINSNTEGSIHQNYRYFTGQLIG